MAGDLSEEVGLAPISRQIPTRLVAGEADAEEVVEVDVVPVAAQNQGQDLMGSVFAQAVGIVRNMSLVSAAWTVVVQNVAPKWYENSGIEKKT